MNNKIDAIAILKRQDNVLNSLTCSQTDLNVTADYMLKYLGENSHVYKSFQKIDINHPTPLIEKQNASALVKKAIIFIEENGVYEDLQLEILKLQAKDFKNKARYSAVGAIGASILTLIATHAKSILSYILRILHLPPL